MLTCETLRDSHSLSPSQKEKHCLQDQTPPPAASCGGGGWFVCSRITNHSAHMLPPAAQQPQNKQHKVKTQQGVHDAAVSRGHTFSSCCGGGGSSSQTALSGYELPSHNATGEVRGRRFGPSFSSFFTQKIRFTWREIQGVLVTLALAMVCGLRAAAAAAGHGSVRAGLCVREAEGDVGPGQEQEG